LLTWGKPITPFRVQIAPTHQWATATAWRIAWWDFSVEQGTATLYRCSNTAITVAASRRFASSCTAADFADAKHHALVKGVWNTTAAGIVEVNAPAGVLHEFVLDLVARRKQLGTFRLSALAWVTHVIKDRTKICHLALLLIRKQIGCCS